jgi:hypothetical protein
MASASLSSSSHSFQQQQDLTSILSQVKGLEEEKIRLMQLLEAERERLKEVQAKAEKMSEGKRNEMRQSLETVITNWLQDAVQDEKIREEFKKGMGRLVDDTAEDSGVWQVVCCASNVHARRLQEFERMRLENEELRSKGVGEFKDEGNRKRTREPGDGEQAGGGGGGASAGGNIWLEFEQECRNGRTFGTAL